jgi:hypothetical protein
MKTSRTLGLFGAIACSVFAISTLSGCADDNTSAGGACKGDSACCSSEKSAGCSADKSACCKDKAADAKTTDMTHDSMNK